MGGAFSIAVLFKTPSTITDAILIYLGGSAEKEYQDNSAFYSCEDMSGGWSRVETKEECTAAAEALSWSYPDGYLNENHEWPPRGCSFDGWMLIYNSYQGSTYEGCGWFRCACSRTPVPDEKLILELTDDSGQQKLRFQQGADDGPAALRGTGSVALAQNTWYSAVVRRDSVGLSLWLDGSEVWSAVSDDPFPEEGVEVKLKAGSDALGAKQFRGGALGYVGVFENSLSDAQVLTLANVHYHRALALSSMDKKEFVFPTYDGSGEDGLVGVRAQSLWAAGDSDFTFAGHITSTSRSNVGVIFARASTDLPDAGFSLILRPDGHIALMPHGGITGYELRSDLVPSCVTDTSTFVAQAGGPWGAELTSATPVPVGTKTHIMFVKESLQLRLYVDGALSCNVTTGGPAPSCAVKAGGNNAVYSCSTRSVDDCVADNADSGNDCTCSNCDRTLFVDDRATAPPPLSIGARHEPGNGTAAERYEYFKLSENARPGSAVATTRDCENLDVSEPKGSHALCKARCNDDVTCLELWAFDSGRCCQVVSSDKTTSEPGDFTGANAGKYYLRYGASLTADPFAGIIETATVFPFALPVDDDVAATCTDSDEGTTCNAHSADEVTCLANTDGSGDPCVYTPAVLRFRVSWAQDVLAADIMPLRKIAFAKPVLVPDSRESMFEIVLSDECHAPYGKECCLEMALAAFGTKVISSRTALVEASDGSIPVGCSVESGGDWAAHFNVLTTPTDRSFRYFTISDGVPAVMSSNPPNADAYTYEFVLRLREFNVFLFGSGGAGNGEVSLHVGPEGYLHVGRWGVSGDCGAENGANVATSSGQEGLCGVAQKMSLHEWHHVAAVIERATLKLYLDGALVGSRSTGDRGSVLFDFSPTPRHSFFARRQSCSGSFDGDVQSVKLWSRARNASELAQASGAGKELRCVGGGDSLEYCAVAEVDVGDDGARVVGQLTDRSGNGRDAARFVACPQEGEGMSISASSARLLARYTTITAALAGQSEERTRTLLPVHGPYRTENSPVITRVVSSLTAHTHLHIQFDLYDQAPASLSLADMCVVVVDGVLYAGSPNGDGNFKFVQVDDDGDVSITKPSASTYRACQVDVVVPHNSSSATLQIGPTVSFLDTSLDRNPFWKWAFGPVRTRGFNLADNGRGSLGHKEISMLFERVYTDGREWSDHLLEGQKCASVLDGLSLGCSTRGCPPTLPGFCRGEADCLFLAQEWCVRTEIVAGSFENVCAAISFLPDVSTTSVRLCGTTETVALSSAVGSKTILRDPAVFQGSDNSRAVGKELRYLGTARCSPSNPCGACVGHCDDNEDCGGSLECFHRADSEDRVPGCSFQGMHDMDTADYCFDPKAPTTSERLPEQGWEGSGHGPALTADGIGRMSNYDGCPYRWGTYEYWSCYYRGNYGSKEYRATTSAVGWALNPEDEALQWVENCGSSRTETNGGCRTVRGPFAEGAEMKLTLENIGEDHTAVRIRMRMYRGDWGWDNAPVRMYVDGEQVLETSVKESSFPHEGGLFSPKYGKSPFASYENVDLTVPHSGSRLELEISLRDVWYDITKSQFLL